MKRQLQTHINLMSQHGITTVPVEILYDDSEDEAIRLSQITLTYNGVEYQGRGTDYLWCDTFADLQKKLPQGVKLACCMTCRHGNMCPYGNKVNELFCTKDVDVTTETIYTLFDNHEDSEKRSVFYYGFCDDFVHQSNDFFTYNDYLYRLSGKMSEL